jgi:hypothetical protein
MTTANPQLEKDTLFMVIGMDRAEDKGCNQRKIANSEVIATDSKKAVERWTIDRCGTLFRYGITYTPSPNGGTMIGINPPETVGKAR